MGAEINERTCCREVLKQALLIGGAVDDFKFAPGTAGGFPRVNLARELGQPSVHHVPEPGHCKLL